MIVTIQTKSRIDGRLPIDYACYQMSDVKEECVRGLHIPRHPVTGKFKNPPYIHPILFRTNSVFPTSDSKLHIWFSEFLGSPPKGRNHKHQIHEAGYVFFTVRKLYECQYPPDPIFTELPGVFQVDFENNLNRSSYIHLYLRFMKRNKKFDLCYTFTRNENNADYTFTTVTGRNIIPPSAHNYFKSLGVDVKPRGNMATIKGSASTFNVSLDNKEERTISWNYKTLSFDDENNNS